MGKKGISPFNIAVCATIFIAVIVAILETESSFKNAYGMAFEVMERVFLVFFLLEYLVRVYVSPEMTQYHGRFARLRYMKSPMAIIDLLVLLPYMLSVGASEVFLLRLLRVLRILRLSRLGRFSSAWKLLWNAIVSRRFELMMSGLVAIFLLIVSSTFLFLCEAHHQPEDFGSIPRALWWSIATLTTVGYGDVTPVTAIGRVFAGITAIIGIGLVAMPTGILAAAFSDAFQKSRDGYDREGE
jgi:voltage-gated potassium channel